MMHAITSLKKAKNISIVLFLIGLAIVSFTGEWWPGLLLAVGFPLAVKHYLLGQRYDVLMVLLVFLGAFLSVSYEFSWPVILPVLFTLGAIYLLCRDLMEEHPLAEEEEDLNEEIQEDQHKKS
jgi:hypothetical protein